MSSFETTAGRGGPHPIGFDRESERQRPADHAGGMASKRIVVGYGFWIFLLSDIIMFSAFFATYAVLVGQIAGGPSGRELFDLRNTGIETGCLLLSSFACGLASVGAQVHRGSLFYGAMAATFVLGAAFIGLEVQEFVGLVARDKGNYIIAFLKRGIAVNLNALVLANQINNICLRRQGKIADALVYHRRAGA